MIGLCRGIERQREGCLAWPCWANKPTVQEEDEDDDASVTASSDEGPVGICHVNRIIRREIEEGSLGELRGWILLDVPGICGTMAVVVMVL